MINRIRIENFKCLKDVSVDLGPFNVLIGPNDSGKTSFLEAIRLLGKTVSTCWGGEPLTSLADFGSLVWQRRGDLSIGYEVSGTADLPFEYRLSLPPSNVVDFSEALKINGIRELAKDSNGVVEYKKWSLGGGPPAHTYLSYFADLERKERVDAHPLLEIARSLRSSELYQFNPKEMRLHAKAEVNPTMTTSGDNLVANLLALLTGPNRQAVISMENKLREAIPTLSGVATPLVNDNERKHEIQFTLSENSVPSISIPCSQASDGAILVVGYLVLAFGNTPQILLVEEPENGLHPSLLKMVIDLLRKISTGEIGNKPRQVILTTHSPLLLNFVRAEEVRIFRRDEHQATTITPMSDVPNIERLQKEFAPGELWYLFGEDDLLKGQAK